MAEWITVLALVVFGLVLLLLELIFIPGTTIVGILGAICSGYGIFLGYDYFGSYTGSIILAGVALVSVLGLYFSFKNKSWERFALKDVISSRVNEDEHPLELGARGITISALRPIGSAEFWNQVKEVRTQGTFLDSGVEVQIVRIEGNRIFVEPLKNKD